MDFAEQNQVASHLVTEHWYYQAKFALLRRTLSTAGILGPKLRLADLGCGLGVFLTLLEREKLLTTAQMIGIDPATPEGQLSIGGSVPIVAAWPEESFDLILMMDVLEHIDNDQEALAQAWEKLKPGDHVFITVPAFAFLWSRHDENLGHKRRYTLKSLRRLLETIPRLRILKLHYFYALIFPIAVIVRLLRKGNQENSSDLKPAPAWLNLLLRKLLSAELIFAPANRLAGLTAVALVQKIG
jgi:2-polyprenyl-3-methyl-5-hydroxy-6-metoxy-1,4-benzoquinol methylase